MKIGRNAMCPCGQLEKYKTCCQGKVDWEAIFAGRGDMMPHLSARGRNLLFVKSLADILQLDQLPPKAGIPGFKQAFTPAAVRKIFEAVADIWAEPEWVANALRGEATHSSALYMGTFDPERVFEGIGRISLYSDTILLPDPFPHPKYIRPQYNPLNVPEQHLGTALRYSILWLTLAPWIQAGIVKFVRTLGDLDPALELSLMESQRKKFESEPRLKQAMDDYVSEEGEELFGARKREIVFSMPEELVEQAARKMNPSITKSELQSLKRGLQRQRDLDPYYIDPRNERGERVPAMMLFTTGANLAEAKLMANLSGSHLVTDMRPRWVEIEIDRESGKIDDAGWSAFAKAFQGLPFRYLNRVPLPAALELRKEERLQELRGFLRRVWKSAVPEQSYKQAAIDDLASELRHEVNKAEAEWDKIDRELLKWFGSTSTVGALVAPLLGSGAAGWAAAGLGVALAGATQLAVAVGLRDTYAKRYPAGFFLNLQRRTTLSDDRSN